MDRYYAGLGLRPMRYPAMSPNMRSVIASPAIVTDLAIVQSPRATP